MNLQFKKSADLFSNKRTWEGYHPCLILPDVFGSKLLKRNIDPLGQSTVTAGRDNYFRTCCPSVFWNLAKQKNRKQWSLLVRLWVWPSGSLMTLVLLILAQAQTKAQAWKMVHYFWWWCPSVHTYIRTYVRPYIRKYVRTYVQNKTKQTDQTVKPLFKLVLWLVLGRGSLYDTSLVIYIIVTIFQKRNHKRKTYFANLK